MSFHELHDLAFESFAGVIVFYSFWVSFKCAPLCRWVCFADGQALQARHLQRLRESACPLLDENGPGGSPWRAAQHFRTENVLSVFYSTKLYSTNILDFWLFVVAMVNITMRQTNLRRTHARDVRSLNGTDAMNILRTGELSCLASSRDLPATRRRLPPVWLFSWTTMVENVVSHEEHHV